MVILKKGGNCAIIMQNCCDLYVQSESLCVSQINPEFRVGYES